MMCDRHASCGEMHTSLALTQEVAIHKEAHGRQESHKIGLQVADKLARGIFKGLGVERDQIKHVDMGK